MKWATSVWWLLRYIGFDNVRVLNGGLDNWNNEGRTLSTETVEFPAGTLVAKPRPEIFVEKEEVLASIDNPDVVTLNALPRAYHAGEGESRYGRPGRIPGSVNVAAGRVISRKDLRFTSLEKAAEQFEAVGTASGDNDQRIINYCGGGSRQQSTCSYSTSWVMRTLPSMTGRWGMGKGRILAYRDRLISGKRCIPG